MRVLLINPPSGLYIREDRCQVPVEGLSATAVRPPLDLAYLAAVAREKGAIATIRDYPAAGADWDAYARDLADIKPSVLVVSVTTPTLAGDMDAVARAKAAGVALTIAKGAHFLTEAAKVLADNPALDIAIVGEYEESFADIITGMPLPEIAGIAWRENGAVRVNPMRGFIADLNALPFPARDLLDNDLYRRPDTGERQTTIQTNRGCPSNCIYCLAAPVSGRQLRLRSPENIVAELRECVEQHGIRNFFFRADTFTINKPWVMAVCSAIAGSGLDIAWVCNSRVDTLDEARLNMMKKAGCWLVSLGIEAGTEAGLQQIRKGTTLAQARAAVQLCRRIGIKTFCFYMVGLPWDDEASIAATAAFARELDSDFAEFHIAVPFPGTDLLDIVQREQLWQPGADGKYDHAHPAIRTRHLSAARVEQLRRRALLRFYLRPRYIVRTLRHAGPAQFSNYVKFGCATLKRLLLPD